MANKLFYDIKMSQKKKRKKRKPNKAQKSESLVTNWQTGNVERRKQGMPGLSLK